MDVITALASRNLEHITENIFGYLDAHSLRSASHVSDSWKDVVVSGRFWKKLTLHKVQTDNRWAGIASRRQCLDTITELTSEWSYEDHVFYDEIYDQISKDMAILKTNWSQSIRSLNTIAMPARPVEIEFDKDVLVVIMSNLIQIYTLRIPQLVKSIDVPSLKLAKLDGDFIYSCLRDGTVQVWEWKTGTNVNTVHTHTETCDMALSSKTLFTASCYGCVIEWDVTSPAEIKMLRKLEDYSYNSSDPEQLLCITVTPQYMVSGSMDINIKVWSRLCEEYSREPNHTLVGHKTKVTSLQHNAEFLASGDINGFVILWTLDDMSIWRIIRAHDYYVVSLRLNSQYLLSASLAAKAKIWSLESLKLCQEPKPTNILPSSIIMCMGADDFVAIAGSGCESIDIFDYLLLSPRNFIQEYKDRKSAVAM